MIKRFGSWESAINFFEQHTTNERYGLQARKMLEIIPVIRSDADFKDVHGWSMHGILAMTLPEKLDVVKVMAQDEDIFLVYIDSNLGRVEPTNVSRAMLIETLKIYLQKLKLFI